MSEIPGRYSIPDESQDIRSQWLNAARRMQSIAKSKGVSILTLRVVVDENGDPIYWLTPQVEHVEPAAKAGEFIRRFLGVRD